MLIYAILPLISAVFVMSLGIFVFWKNKKVRLNQIFFLLILCIVIWLFGTFMMFLAKEDEWKIFWDRFTYVGVVLIPTIGYHFSLIFSKVKTGKKLLYLGYFFSFLFLFLSRTNYFVEDLYKYPWGVHTQARFFHHIFLIFLSLYLFLSFYNLYRHYQGKTVGIERAQAKYTFFGFLVLTFGGLAFLPAYGINIYPFPYLAGVISSIILAYAIVKYRLMDIRLVFGRGFVYLLSFATVVAVAFSLMFLNEKLPQPVPFNIAGSLIVVFSIVLFQFLFRFYERIASKYFYYAFYSYQRVLTDLGIRLTQLLELDKLASLVTATLVNTMKLERTVILLRDPETGVYQIKKNIGFKEENGISLVKDNFLTFYLEKTQKVLVYEELSLAIRDTSESEEKEKLVRLQANMKRIEAALCLPLFIEDKIIGMIVLGNKLSGSPYSEQDIELLTNLSSQTSIALQNARLYSQVQDLSQNLQQKVDEQTKELREAYEELKVLDKAKSEFISMASHQLRTPLTAIKGYISMLLEETYGKPPKKMTKPLKNVLISNERLVKIVNDLLNISKIELGRMDLEIQEVKIEDLAQSCCEEMKTAAEKKGLKFLFKKPKKPLLKIKIDQFKIRQVILNLIDNAIRYTQTGEIVVRVEKRNSNILISFKDTGDGLSKEDQRQIFAGFVRGTAGVNLFVEGAGLGLYVARKFLELHRGRIWAESEGKGKGSTFYVEIPMNIRTCFASLSRTPAPEQSSVRD